jgi:hypothetical protein
MGCIFIEAIASKATGNRQEATGNKANFYLLGLKPLLLPFALGNLLNFWLVEMSAVVGYVR